MIRTDRERKTVKVIIELYCKLKHGTRNELCGECGKLLAYAQRKLIQCPMGENKPACTKCPVHCYEEEMRERIRKIMRFSGPRMLFYHPVLTIFHLIDKR